MKRTHVRKTWGRLYDRLHKWIVVAMITALTVGPLVAQYARVVDQGKGGVVTAGWPMRLCDTSGNCITLVLVGANYVVPVTVTSGSVTVTGTLPITGTVAATQSGPWTVTASPTGTTTIVGTVTGVTGTFTPTGTTTVAGTLTGVTGTMAATQSGAWAVTASLATGTNTIGAITNTAFAVTNTVADNIAQVLGVALSTANPFIDGGRASTDTTASVANGAVVVFRADKWGNIVIVPAPQDMNLTSTSVVTATTVSSVAGSAPGANYKWALSAISSCNLSGVVATQLDVTDSTGTIYSFPWTQTATTAGEDRCIVVQWPDPYLTAANSTISVKLTTSNATGVRTIITGHKTGT